MKKRAKLLRELRRARESAAGRIARVSEYFAQRRRDRTFGADLCDYAGGRAFQPKVALLLIWQPDGLAGSILATCRHLHACGYAPLVVSNGALCGDDHARLLPLVWRLIERPNLGHDFGGYRDGIMLLQKYERHPERLVILNDSIWFPLQENCDLLARLEHAPGHDGFSGAAWMERPGRAHRAHFQSYFLMFGPRALGHPAFMQFWRRYPVSSRRSSVLLHGEKGLSRAMMQAGLVAPALLSPVLMMQQAENMSTAGLCKVLEYAALTDPDMIAARDRILGDAATETARPALLRLVERSVMNGHFVETHPYLAAQVLGFHFLKKRKDATGIEGRRQVLRALQAGDMPVPQTVMMDEIQTHDRQNASTC
ncbi:rhamnan synthesis F family protein [Pseudorhodobacter aquimaris]|uniref:rhamnan synthesis F family protein n=1 Tax=Pseudorhodobacter aquimaris TaxID=687412 RepID=UPI00067D0A44|nr:rhamnan synthesis F family protein [Pseudorhodobacter aquimaris]